jgi:hypothetical protein
MAGSSLSDRDGGYSALLKRLTAETGVSLEIGVFGEKAAQKHDNSDLTIGDIAEIHEFGSELAHIPERSWLRGYVDENRPRLEEMVRRLAGAVVAGKLTTEQALDQLGLKVVGEIQTRIANNIPPPLKQKTIDRKGSSVALIDTEQFRSSIAHAVTKELGHGF